MFKSILVSRFVRAAFFTAFAASSVACNNYTAHPVCSDANAVLPPGLTGVYTVSLQDPDFAVQKTEIEVIYYESGVKGAVAKRLQDGSEEESRTCQVGGHVIDETYVEHVDGYQQKRLYVTNMGLTWLPVFFDKVSLDAAGIETKIFEVPAGVRDVIGHTVADGIETLATKAIQLFGEDATPGLMVGNDKVDPAALMEHAHAGPIGLTLLRK